MQCIFHSPWLGFSCCCTLEFIGLSSYLMHIQSFLFPKAIGQAITRSTNVLECRHFLARFMCFIKSSLYSGITESHLEITGLAFFLSKKILVIFKLKIISYSMINKKKPSRSATITCWMHKHFVGVVAPTCTLFTLGPAVVQPRTLREHFLSDKEFFHCSW